MCQLGQLLLTSNRNFVYPLAWVGVRLLAGNSSRVPVRVPVPVPTPCARLRVCLSAWGAA